VVEEEVVLFFPLTTVLLLVHTAEANTLVGFGSAGKRKITTV
jgi:hypothetical protein